MQKPPKYLKDYAFWQDWINADTPEDSTLAGKVIARIYFVFWGVVKTNECILEAWTMPFLFDKDAPETKDKDFKLIALEKAWEKFEEAFTDKYKTNQWRSIAPALKVPGEYKDLVSLVKYE